MPTDDFRFSPRKNRAHEIHWREWSDDAFAQSSAEAKPILLALSAVWCHWCHVMDETTYSNADVIAEINRGFVAVRVDNDRRPDLNRRYNMGGWPTTAFLTSAGEVITGGTYVPPHPMLELLRNVRAYYASHRDEMSTSATGANNFSQPSPQHSSSEGDLPDAAAVDEILGQILNSFDPSYGGFGTAPKFPQPHALWLLALQAGSCRDDRVDEVLRTSLQAMAKGGLHDAGGGFFRYATRQDWSEPHYEKMLEDNARLLAVYAEASAIYGDADLAATADETAAYLLGTLWQEDMQAFAGSQDADELYYRKGVDERRHLDPPFVDRTAHTDWNCLAASALLRAAQLRAQPNLASAALSALDTLWERGHGRRGMSHYLVADGPGPGSLSPGTVAGLLSDQAQMITALLDAYEHTGGRHYLARAELLADWVDKHLGEPDGSFADRLPDQTTPAPLTRPALDFDGSAAMADALVRLAVYTGDDHYRQRAAATLAWLLPPARQIGIGAAALGAALLRYRSPHLHIVVAGTPEAPATQRLLRAALGVRSPFRTVQVLDPVADFERIVREGYLASAPSAYVCLGPTCLPPTSDPAAVPGLVAGLAAPPPAQPPVARKTHG